MADEEAHHTESYNSPRYCDGGMIRLDGVFKALSHQRRRYTLYYLRKCDQTTVTELARQLTAWERTIAVENVADESTEQVVIELTHSHLPQLAEHHLLEYDARSGDIRYGSPPVVLEKLINVVATIEKPS